MANQQNVPNRWYSKQAAVLPAFSSFGSENDAHLRKLYETDIQIKRATQTNVINWLTPFLDKFHERITNTCGTVSIVHSGSTWKALKISSPNEFDFQFRFHDLYKSHLFVLCKILPLDDGMDLIINQDFQHVSCSIPTTVIKEIFRRIAQDVLATQKDKYQNPSISIHGPAVTVRFNNAPIEGPVSVDLVPSIAVEVTDVKNQIPTDLLQFTYNQGQKEEFWKQIECVPKEPNTSATHLWKRSYTSQEKFIVKYLLPLEARHAIKILKLIRDRKRLTMLKSYFFQCVVLWIYIRAFEQTKGLTTSQLLAWAIELLIGAVQKKHLGDTFFPHINLLMEIQEDDVTRIVASLSNIKEALQGNGSLIQAIPL